MKRVFLDTNILLDFALGREHAEEAEKILALGLAGAIEVCASFLTYANMGFILRHHPKEERYSLVKMMRDDVLVLPNDSRQLDSGLSLYADDIEDALQYECAVSGHCNIIVTNNKRDFEPFSNLPIMTAKEFLLFYDGEE
ncbi:MAG: PIN domain-containing protein [Prevotella sp.]|nr:PIN domain-containing protein [Prevotella sp.]